MLIEIQCDKFVSFGETRRTIRFHSGLNAVIGDDNGSNSIGKSTFLMILDFVFGGSDYIKKCEDVQRNIGEHTINFAFEFDGNSYYFARNNIDYKHVICCDKDYSPLYDRWTIEEYWEFLADHYKTNVEPNLSWRSVVSRFIRVWKRDSLTDDSPLKASNKEKNDLSIKSYMQLYGKYAAVADQIKQAKDAEEQRDAFKKSREYRYIRSAKNKSEFNENNKKIDLLVKKEQELADQSNKGLLNLDSYQVIRITELDEQIAMLERERARVQIQLNALRRDFSNSKRNYSKTYSELRRFFPNVEFSTIENVERFHKKLSDVLKEEFRCAEKDLVIAYQMIQNRLIELKEEVNNIKNVPNVSEAILKEYATITTELNNLRESNSNYIKMNQLNNAVIDYANTRDRVISRQLSAIELMVNDKMRVINARILKNDQHLPPIITINNLSKYSFSTPNDGGTGAQYRGIITFDLANLELSQLPFVIHDMPMLVNIEKKVMTEIISEYISQKTRDKQVFIAFDRLDTYDGALQRGINDNCVLRLSPGGNELFGRAWNIKTEEESVET